MLPGYNHNITYKEQQFHIQTEDSGIKNPCIITLLYRDGVIISSQKTGYADILKAEQLWEIVEDLMKEQHKEMLRCLKRGEFDEKIITTAKGVAFTAGIETAQRAETDHSSNGPQLLFEDVKPLTSTDSRHPEADKVATAKPTPTSLDDAILDFFGAAG